jgi:hypothetical protein
LYTRTSSIWPRNHSGRTPLPPMGKVIDTDGAAVSAVTVA